MSQEFSVDVDKLEDGFVLVTIHGFLDAHTFEQMENTFNQLFDEEEYQIIVELSDVPYISSAGAGVFIGAVGTSQDADGNIVMLNPQANVKEVFDLLGLTQIFSFSSDIESARKLFE
ncbi:STAS domain-containing protein [Planctomycetota bacterium]